LIAGIFLAIAAAMTAAPAVQAPAGFQAISRTSPVHHPAGRIPLAYDRPHPMLAVMQTSYTTRKGDTLSSIAAAVYGHASRWPALWYVNRREVRNPDALRPGVTLQLTAWHPNKAWLARKALANVPKPPPPPDPAQAPAQLAASSQTPAAADPAPAASGPATGSVTAASAYEACVITRESGGNPAAVNSSSGAGGLYGFLPSTWASLGYPGLPEDAPVSEQQQAFATLYAQAGRSPWITDGC
jgi:hypothetical protein